MNITAKLLKRLEPKNTPYFIRSTSIKGFAVKVNPSGSIRFIAETRFKGETFRKTIGTHPILSIQRAQKETLSFLQSVQTGQHKKVAKSYTHSELLHSYTLAVSLKPNTIRNYKEVIQFYLSDWLSKTDVVNFKFVQPLDWQSLHWGSPLRDTELKFTWTN
jgi:hypothetical protein